MTALLTGKNSDFLNVAAAAAGRGDLKTVKAVLKQRPLWHKHVGSHGRTMLWEASHRGKLEMVKFLVKRGADLNACGSRYTPYFVEISCFCAATVKKHQAVADFLEHSGAKHNIHMAAFLGQLNLVKKYLSRSRKRLNMGHKQHVMAGKNDKGLDVVPKAAPWATPLCYALRGGDPETAEFLIAEGATIKGFDEAMFTAADDDVAMVRLLLENGADKKHAPSALPDGSEMYELLSSYGIKTAKSELNEEFVYLCRGDRGGNPEEVLEMLRHGANVNHQDSKGKTALHRAAKAGFVKTVKILLDNGASVFVRDAAGETVLFDVARSTIKKKERLIEVIELLRQAGADLKAENNRGQIPMAISKNAGIRKYLKV